MRNQLVERCEDDGFDLGDFRLGQACQVDIDHVVGEILELESNKMNGVACTSEAIIPNMKLLYMKIEKAASGLSLCTFGSLLGSLIMPTMALRTRTAIDDL